MAAAIQRSGTLHRAMWRWHFYAGVIVLPVLLWLAATGGLYLYKPEIEAMVYRDWSSVTPTTTAMPLDRLVTSVERQAGGRVTQVMRPADPAASWRMMVTGEEGRRLAFVDPYRGTLLGTASGGGAMATVRDLHSLIITGPIGNALVEIVAGWAVVLVVTGLVLWWPSGGSPAVGVRGSPRGRLFWRDLHGSIGVFVAAVILFLAVTGMPWTGFAGKQLQDLVVREGLGRPRPPATPGDHAAHDSLSWSMQEHPTPQGGPKLLGPQAALHRAEMRGLPDAWTMTLPTSPGAPYVFSVPIVRAQDARALYVDAASGMTLLDARFAQFGAGARAIEWGIATHQGQQYGEINRLVMLAGCIGVWLLGITGVVMWWKRREGGRLRAPPRADPKRLRAVALAMLAGGLLFPLTGLTMLAALLAEQAWRRLRA